MRFCVYIPIRAEWLIRNLMTKFHASFISWIHIKKKHHSAALETGDYFTLSRPGFRRLQHWQHWSTLAFSKLPFLLSENLYIASLVWQTDSLNDHFLFAICVETVNVLEKKHDSSFEWPFDCAVGTIIHCSLFFLSGPLMIWLKTLWWPSHCSYVGWTISAWTMNPWWTLHAFWLGTINLP